MKSVPLAMVFLLFAAALVADDELIVPVHEEPRHRLVFGRPLARILDLNVPPGDTTLYHVHSSPIFYVTLGSSKIRTQRLGEDWVIVERPFSGLGDTRIDESYAESPLTHRVDNIGESALRAILVLNEKEAPRSPAAAANLGALPGKTEIDSAWFRQSRLTVPAAATVEWNGTDAGVVLVLVSENHVTVDVERFDETFGLTTIGNILPVAPNNPLRIVNRSPDPATLVAVAVL